VTALTDSSGNVVATYEYDAFGNLIKETGSVENPYRYAGYRYDTVTGLYYLQSRYYHPEIGRFLTRDSFEGFKGGPLSLNRYAYVENNPVTNADHDGYYKRGRKGWKYKHTSYGSSRPKQWTVGAIAIVIAGITRIPATAKVVSGACS
jgi:RHS repeat-associated protein